jgi:hypothetical protein
MLLLHRHWHTEINACMALRTAHPSSLQCEDRTVFPLLYSGLRFDPPHRLLGDIQRPRSHLCLKGGGGISVTYGVRVARSRPRALPRASEAGAWLCS